MEPVHIIRMRRLADHLVSDYLRKDYSNLSFIHISKQNQLIFFNDKYYQLLPWFEEELDFLFPSHFTRDYRGNISYLKNPKVSAPFALPEFFHISTEQFLHCFCFGRQSAEYGRFRMTHLSSPIHCGRILYQFLRNVLRQQEIESNLVIRKVLIEKIGKKSPEAILRSLTDLENID